MLTLVQLLNRLDSLMWGKYTMALLLFTGLFLTLRYKFIQIRKLPYALKLTFNKTSLSGATEDKEHHGDITPFQALTMTLAATVGNGNIAGVATAIALGGPGAVFWMWITASLGMATRATEALLGVKFRRKAEDGTFIGGAFYYLEDGTSPIIGKLPAKILAVAFALSGMIAAFGIGNMVQANSVVLSLSRLFGVSQSFQVQFKVITGITLSVLTGLVLLGGVKRLGQVAEKLVPAMAAFYILGALTVLILNLSKIPYAFALIFKSAFTGHAAAGGFAGATVAKALQYGVARGLFSNEAGLGTGSLAHAAAKTPNPARQGMVAMVGTFMDTLVICTMTALAIIITGVWTSGETSTALTIKAFSVNLGTIGAAIVALGSTLFGYSTLLGWSYYGEQCTEYLFGVKSNTVYRVLFVIFVAVGAVAGIDLVWTVSDIFNGFMAVPNLIGLLLLSSVAARELKKEGLL